tara:strand:- start:496 stop:951 length:456 start_codon:yes stop_codon:yes gene_type:complete
MSFAKSLSIADEMEREINKEARALTINLWNGLTRVNPVGNPDLWVYNHPTRGYIDYVGYFGQPDYVGGRSRSNWFVSMGLPSRKTTDETLPASSRQSLGSAIARAKNTKYPLMIVSNNMDYIEKLNDGSSTQAPKKFIESEIDRVVNASNK